MGWHNKLPDAPQSHDLFWGVPRLGDLRDEAGRSLV